MKVLAFITLAALPVTLGNPFVFSKPASSGLRLVGRDLRQMEIYNCNVCTTDCDEGGCIQNCDQTNYATTNGGTSAGCNDPSIPLNDDECSAFGQIPTPYGSGNWVATDKCSSDRSEGAYDGCIIASDSSWGCTCFASSGDFAQNCGLEYDCYNVYTCECDACANNDCGTCGG